MAHVLYEVIRRELSQLVNHCRITQVKSQTPASPVMFTLRLERHCCQLLLKLQVLLLVLLF